MLISTTAWKGTPNYTNTYGAYFSRSSVIASPDANPTLNLTGQHTLGRPWNNASRVVYMDVGFLNYLYSLWDQYLFLCCLIRRTWIVLSTPQDSASGQPVTHALRRYTTLRLVPPVSHFFLQRAWSDVKNQDPDSMHPPEYPSIISSLYGKPGLTLASRGSLARYRRGWIGSSSFANILLRKEKKYGCGLGGQTYFGGQRLKTAISYRVYSPCPNINHLCKKVVHCEAILKWWIPHKDYCN